MTLDYNIIPAITMEMAFSDIEVQVEHNAGKDASGELEMAFDALSATAEANDGKDANSLAITLSFGTIGISAEANDGHDSGMEFELALAPNISAEIHAGTSFWSQVVLQGTYDATYFANHWCTGAPDPACEMHKGTICQSSINEN